MANRVRVAILALTVAACGPAAKDATSDAAPRTAQVLPAGSRVNATLQDALSSRTDKPGRTLRAVVSRDVVDARGSIVIPAGSDVTLTVAQLESGNSVVRPNGRLALVVNSVSVNGQDQQLTAALDPLQHHMEGAHDVIVSAGTPIVFTLSHTLNVSTR